jgi:hypothetical protein
MNTRMACIRSITLLSFHRLKAGSLDRARAYPAQQSRFCPNIGDMSKSSTTGVGERVATFPLGNAAPEEPCVRAFPAHGSRTALSALLTPGLPNCTSPSQAVTSLVHLIAETRALNRRKTVSFKLPCIEPQMNTCDNCTTRKSAPFQVRANLEPLCGLLPPAIRFFRVLISTRPTAHLADHLP